MNSGIETLLVMIRLLLAPGYSGDYRLERGTKRAARAPECPI